MVGHSGMRLAELPPQLELCQMCEQHSGGGGGRESPLQEVNLCTLPFSWQWEDKLRMPLGGGFDAGVGCLGDDGA